MPKLMTDDAEIMETIDIPGVGDFQFSGMRPDKLTATEYTLVTAVIDVTGSVSGFADELLGCLKSVVTSCQGTIRGGKNPRSENLLLRVLTFNTQEYEIHGFRPVDSIDADVEYAPFRPAGTTALFDASYSAVGATLKYSKMLMDDDYDVNGILFVMTDGDDNASHRSNPGDIADKIKEAMADETIIESMQTFLIGINVGDSFMKGRLEEFKKDAEFTEFIDAGEATPGKLAKIAEFVSESVSSQSQALGSGGASRVLRF